MTRNAKRVIIKVLKAKNIRSSLQIHIREANHARISAEITIAIQVMMTIQTVFIVMNMMMIAIHTEEAEEEGEVTVDNAMIKGIIVTRMKE